LASQRRIALPVIRALIRDQPQVYLLIGLTGPMLDATATAEDKKWAALSTELNEQFDRGQKNYAARLSSPHSAFSMLRKCCYLGPDTDDEAIVKFVAAGLSHTLRRNRLGSYGLL
jgi:hypothetical protein